MKCHCGGRTDTVDGRYIEQGYWRRRVCRLCGENSTTVEQVCVTEKGTRVKQPKVHVPAVPRVKLAPRRSAAHKPKQEGRAVLEQRAQSKEPPVAPARNRIEDLKMQRALEKEDY